MGLLNDLENQLERQIPARLQIARQKAWNDYRRSSPTASWTCPATTATPAPSLPATAPSAGKSRCSVAPRAAALNSIDYWRDDPAGRPGSLTRQRAISGSQKTRDRALTLAPQGLSYARAGQLADCVKSAIGKWLRRTPLTAPQFADAGVCPLTLELDGLGTHTRAGRTELKVIRDANTGAAFGSFGPLVGGAWWHFQLGGRGSWGRGSRRTRSAMAMGPLRWGLSWSMDTPRCINSGRKR